MLSSRRSIEENVVSERVSVVIPYYNGSRFIAEAIASVRAQTLPAHEIVVVDDGSRPEDAAVLDRVAAEAGPTCRAEHLPRNRGVCVARNLGILRATGTYIAFLDCDDMWRPDKLEKQMGFLADHPDYRAVHCGLQVLYDDGREGSALFDPTKKVCEDLDLFLRFTSQYPIGVVDEPLLIRRVQADGASRNVPRFYHDADRVYRDYRYVFQDQGAAADTLVDLHSDFLQRAIYARDAGLFWNVLRRGTRNDVTVPRLLFRVARDLIRNRRARQQGD
jgi:glycosyltransferase involved in cell wall biosynthesis